MSDIFDQVERKIGRKPRLGLFGCIGIVVVVITVLGFIGALVEVGVVIWAITHPKQVAASVGSLAGTADKAYKDTSK